MNMEKQKTASLKCLNALDLKLIAMALMLSDHIWYVFFQDQGPCKIKCVSYREGNLCTLFLR